MSLWGANSANFSDRLDTSLHIDIASKSVSSKSVSVEGGRGGEHPLVESLGSWVMGVIVVGPICIPVMEEKGSSPVCSVGMDWIWGGGVG